MCHLQSPFRTIIINNTTSTGAEYYNGPTISLSYTTSTATTTSPPANKNPPRQSACPAAPHRTSRKSGTRTTPVNSIHARLRSTPRSSPTSNPTDSKPTHRQPPDPSKHPSHPHPIPSHPHKVTSPLFPSHVSELNLVVVSRFWHN